MTISDTPKERTLLLGERVSQKSVSDLIKSIHSINRDDEEKVKELKKFKRKPIQLMLNTYGGSVYDGLALISAIELSETPVHITVIGSAMSMGLFILASGEKRMASKHATIMYHQLSGIAWDKLEGIKDNVKEWKRIEKVCEKILFKNTSIMKEHLAPYKKRKKEWFITPKEALKLGIIDEIIK